MYFFSPHTHWTCITRCQLRFENFRRTWGSITVQKWDFCPMVTRAARGLRPGLHFLQCLVFPVFRL